MEWLTRAVWVRPFELHRMRMATKHGIGITLHLPADKLNVGEQNLFLTQSQCKRIDKFISDSTSDSAESEPSALLLATDAESEPLALLLATDAESEPSALLLATDRALCASGRARSASGRARSASGRVLTIRLSAKQLQDMYLNELICKGDPIIEALMEI